MANGNKKSRKLHYVPRGYLRPFTNANNTHVWCFDKDFNRSYFANIGDILWAWDYYKIDSGTVLEDLAVIENAKELEVNEFFETLERKFPTIRSNLINNVHSISPFTSETDKQFLAQYIYFQMMRTTDLEATIKDLIYMTNIATLELANRVVVPTKRIPVDLIPIISERVAKNLASDNHRKIRIMFDKISYNDVYYRLLSLMWTVLVAEEDTEFITSDHPIHRLSGSGDKQPGLGFLDEDIEVFFPLTPKYAIVLNDKQGHARNKLGDFNVYRIEKLYVEEYNNLQIIRANRFVISKKTLVFTA